MGLKKIIDSLEEATGKILIIGPVLAATLTTVIVFVPFLYLQGEVRLYYLPFAYAVGLALLASLLVAFTFVPAAAGRILRGRRPGSAGGSAPPVYQRAYRTLVGFSLRRPWPVVVLAGLLFAGAYRLFDRHVVRGPAWGRWGEQTRIDIWIHLPRGETCSCGCSRRLTTAGS